MDVCVGFGIWAPRSELESRISGLKVNNWWGVWVHSCVFGGSWSNVFVLFIWNSSSSGCSQACCLSGFRCQLRSLWTRMNSLAACCTCIFPILQEGFQYCAVGLGGAFQPLMELNPRWIFMFFKFSTQMQHHQNFYRVFRKPRKKSHEIHFHHTPEISGTSESEGIWFCWCTCCTARLGQSCQKVCKAIGLAVGKAIGVKICY